MQIPQLRRWRERQGLTQKELADKAGVSVRSVAGYEGGDGTRPNTARKLADALGVSVADLIGEEYPKGPQLDLESFLIEKTGHAYLATHSYEELHERAREEGQEFRDACREERDAVLEERKQYPAWAGVIPLFTTGETHTEVQRRYFAVLFSNLSLEDAKRETRQMAEATA